MKKNILIFILILAVLLCFSACGNKQEEVVEPEPVPLDAIVLVPEGAVLNTEDKSISYTAAIADMDLWGYKLYSLHVDWLFDLSGITVELNGENLSLKTLSSNYLIAVKEMNSKEIETLRDKMAEVIANQNNDMNITELQISDPMMLADRHVMLEATINDSVYGSALLYLEDNGSWSLENYYSGIAVALEEYSHAPYINPTQKINGKTPYSIDVNRTQNCVTIYTLDSNDEYTVPFKAMVCSSGREGHESPTGDYSINDFRPRWCYMVDGSYGQYVSGWRSGGYLFHTICYTGQSSDQMMTDEYNLLGSNASLGCIRLQTIDAKWIYENCMIGTPVHVFDSDEIGPLGKPSTLIEHIEDDMANGWDPTDPKPDNPWRTRM